MNNSLMVIIWLIIWALYVKKENKLHVKTRKVVTPGAPDAPKLTTDHELHELNELIMLERWHLLLEKAGVSWGKAGVSGKEWRFSDEEWHFRFKFSREFNAKVALFVCPTAWDVTKVALWESQSAT